MPVLHHRNVFLGPGVDGQVALECVYSTPANEVVEIDLEDETLQVYGNFALMRTGRIDFSVEKSTRSLLGKLTGGEGLL